MYSIRHSLPAFFSNNLNALKNHLDRFCHTPKSLLSKGCFRNNFYRGMLFSATAFMVVSITNSRAYSQDLTGTIYYVDSRGGDDSNPGTSPTDAWQSFAKVNRTSFSPGDSILLKRGEFWSEELILVSSGTPDAAITVSDYGNGKAPIIERLKAVGDYVTYEGIVVDHQKLEGDAVRIRGARNNTLRNITIRNGTRDGIDADKADGVLIENCHIHHFLAGSFDGQVDAHGMVFTDTTGITIRGTEVHHVSGDSFQTDPDRDRNTPDDILIEDCHFWTGPLNEDFNGLWRAGETPGENAIDTKMVKSEWGSLPRMRITIKNIVAHGFIKDGFIANRAVFNMKEKIEAIFDGVTVYDSEIAFRLRGTRGNANVSIKNAVIYDCEKAIRAEDNLSNLVVYNSTFGESIDRVLQFAGGSGGVDSWDWRNNAFIGDVPSIANAPTNISVGPGSFANPQSGDYHLASESLLIDAGQTLSAVKSDRDGVDRSAPYEVGAYEFDGIPSTPTRPEAPSGLLVDTVSTTTIGLKWRDNSTNETRFRIDRRKGSGSFSKRATVNANTSNYTDTGLQANAPYSYRVRAENSVGSSSYSNIVKTKTRSNSSSFPVILQGKKLPEEAEVTLRVSKPSGATSTVLLRLTVFDADSKNEGELEINGNGPLRLFDKQARSKNDNKTATVTFITPEGWWNNGKNTLRFVHTRTSGYRIQSVSVEFNDSGNTDGDQGGDDNDGGDTGLVITNLISETVNSKKPYQLFDLKVGSRMYRDRNYTFTSVPKMLAGHQAIRTGNNDKFSKTSNADFLRFDVNQWVDVYIIYTNKRSAIENGWLDESNGWKLQGFTATTSLDGDEKIRLIRKRRFAAGTIRLPGNGATANLNSMYNVVIKPSSSQSQTTTVVVKSAKNVHKLSPRLEKATNGGRLEVKPLSQTVYEDAEDSALTGWYIYNEGSVQNIPGGANGSKRAIEINGDIENDVFRLADDDGSDWNNQDEFNAEFSVAFNSPNPGAIYFQLATSKGTKYLGYIDREITDTKNPDIIYFKMGDVADGQWHTIRRNLEADLRSEYPDADVTTVEGLYVYGRFKLDDIILYGDE